VIHYTIGQEYRKHWDAYNPLNERGKRATASGGNRVVTALMYLTDVDEGGGTGFINMRTEVAAEQGKVLIFHNCYLGSRSLHPDSNHAGLPVLAGDKWACNLWYRESPMPGGAAAKSRQQKLAQPE
jgi:prolyl 4-hydroxylase